MTQYQVVGQVAHVRTQTPQGRMTRLLYKGSLLPEDVSAEQIRHLLSVKLIASFGGVGGANLPGAALPAPIPGQEPAGNEPANSGDRSPEGSESQTSGSSDTPVDDPERVAARAELPADGSLPKPAQPKAVWVEAAVARGYNYEAAAKSTKAELQDLLK